MKWFLVLLAIVAVHSKATKKVEEDEENVYKIEKEWEHFLDTYELDYEKDPVETERRKQIFTRNYELINAHNRLYNDNRKQKYLMQPTLEEDSDDAEWLKAHTNPPCSLPAVTPSTARTRRAAKPSVVPKAIDWTKGGDIRVTDVKDQEECGSCYIFAAVGVLEAYHKRATNKLANISEKYFLDCGTYKDKNKDVPFGCTGGKVDKVLKYANNIGYSTAAGYKGTYDGNKGNCQQPRDKLIAPKWVTKLKVTENELKKMLAENGPVAVLVNTKMRSFKRYKSGVYSDPDCGDTLTHAVLLVGYGNDKDLGKYWLIKNSHGKNFGENGYYRLERDTNLCGITKEAHYIPHAEK